MIIIPIILIVVALWVISNYNFFVSTKTRIKASIQEIGNQLKRQADLIPNLESSVKGYMKHEKHIFDALTEARKAVVAAVKTGNVAKMADAGNMLSNVLPRLQVIVESNPELKASEVVSKLMDELRDTSDKVMYARRLVIDLTADYNVKRVSFPSSLVAGLFKFDEQPGLITPEKGAHIEVSESDTKTPKVDL
jgi:LemA protein